MSEGIIAYQELGRVPYEEAWALQEELREARSAGRIGDRQLLLEHPPVFTLGRKECRDDFQSSEEAIRAEGIAIVKSNRGGRVTYHGPGQLVGYFICALEGLGLGVKEFVHAVEDILIRSAARFGVTAARDAEHPGVWVGRRKLAAIGLHIAHGVTQHGFALNVDLDLAPYRHITACGIQDRGVVRLADLCDPAPAMVAVRAAIIAETGDVLQRKLVPAEGLS